MSIARGKYDRSLTTADRHEQRLDQLLDDATEVFAARGYAATRVEDLVRHAGISRRTLYEHFDSVEAVLTAVYERAVMFSFQHIATQLIGVSDPIERIHVGVRAYFELIVSDPAAARVIFEEYKRAGPAQAARYELNTTRYAMLMLEFLNAAHVAGRLPRAPDELSVYALTCGLEAVGVRAIHRGEHASAPSIAAAMSRLILDAFGGAG